MTDEVLQVVVVHVRLETKLVLQRDGVGSDQVEAVDLGEKVLLAKLRIFGMPLVDVDPDQAGKVL